MGAPATPESELKAKTRILFGPKTPDFIGQKSEESGSSLSAQTPASEIS
jgi:hypothetical protein